MDGFTVLSLFVGVLFVGAVAIYKKLLDLRSNIPSPGWFWFRQKNHRTFQDLLEFAEKNHAGLVHGFQSGAVRGWKSFFGGIQSVTLVTHPEIAQIILKDEETFIKDPNSFGDVGDLMRDSLVNSNGEKWRKFKDVMAPAFHFEYIKNAVPVFVEKTADLLDLWAEKGGKALPIRSDMSHFTLDTLGMAAFNVDFKSIRGGNHEYLKAYTYLTTPDVKGVRKTSDVLAVQATLSKMTSEIVASKQASDNRVGNEVLEKDFLDRLLAGSDKLTNVQIRDNTFMMFVAGHETTSSALTWALYYLAKFPEMQNRAREEVDTVLNGKFPDAESVKSLTYLDMFIKEVLRHRTPIATVVSRKTTKDAQVGQYRIPKDTIIGVSMYTIHHLKEFWPDPDTFDPLRFSPEKSEGRHPFSYMPFSLGRRNCIGNNFSLLEQKIFLSMVLQRVTLSVNEKCIAKEYPIWQVCWPINIVLDSKQRLDYKQPVCNTRG